MVLLMFRSRAQTLGDYPPGADAELQYSILRWDTTTLSVSGMPMQNWRLTHCTNIGRHNQFRTHLLAGIYASTVWRPGVVILYDDHCATTNHTAGWRFQVTGLFFPVWTVLVWFFVFIFLFQVVVIINKLMHFPFFITKMLTRVLTN